MNRYAWEFSPTYQRGSGKKAPFARKYVPLALALAGLAVPFTANAFNFYLEDITIVTKSGIWQSARSKVGTDTTTTCGAVQQAETYVNTTWMGGQSGGQFTNGGATTGTAMLTYWRDGINAYTVDNWSMAAATPPRTYTIRLFPSTNDAPASPYTNMCDSTSVPVLETALTVAAVGNFGKVVGDSLSLTASAAGTARWLVVEKGAGWEWAGDTTNFKYPYPKTLSDAVTSSAATTSVTSCENELMMGGMMCFESGSLNIIASGSANLASGSNAIGFDSSAWDQSKTYVLYVMLDNFAATSNYGRTYYQELTYAVSGPAAPTLSIVSVTTTGTGTTANLVATSSAGGNGYWVALDGADATAPNAAQVKAGQNSDGTTSSPNVIASGNGAMDGGSPQTFNLTGLSAGSSYTVCLVSDDGSNDSSVTCQNLTTGPAFSNLSPADSSYLNSNYIFGFTLNEGITSGSLTFTRTGGSADPGSPHTCTLKNDSLGAGARTIQPHTTGCVSPITLVDGAIYDAVFNGTDAAGFRSAPAVITGLVSDLTRPTAAASHSISGAKGSNNTVNTAVYEAQDVITISFSEPVLANFGIFEGNPAVLNATVSNGHSLGSPIIAAVSPVNNYATSFTITLGSMGLSLAAGDTLTFTASKVEDRAGNLASSNVVFTLPAPALITAPAAPTGVTATAGDTTATVTFTAPADNGTAITTYTATSSPDGLTGTCAGPTACAITVTGLTNGQAYTFTVTANNGATSAASSPSSSVTPSAVSIPDAPTIGTATAGNGSISAAFTPGSSNGATITEYTVSCGLVTANQFATAYQWVASQTGTSSPITVSGLTNGTAYKCEVKAKNSAGYGNYSTASSAVTPTAPVVTDNAPAPSTNTTLPTGGGTVTPMAGQTVVVTDNGGNGSTISLPAPTLPGSGSTTSTNSVNVALPGTGTVVVSSNSAGTQLQVQQITLPGTSTKVSTVSVSSGSATMTASGAGQTLVTTGVSNGLTVTSGGSGTTATVTTSGNSQSIALIGTANLTLGNTLDTQRTVLSLAPKSGSEQSQANLQVGGQTLSVRTDGGSTQVQIVPTMVNGNSLNALVVTGGTASIIGQSGQVMNVVPAGTGCAGNSGGYFEARSSNATSNVLSVNQGSLALTGYIPSGVVAYHYTSSSCNSFSMTTPLNGSVSKEILIYQGEYVEVDQNGQPVKIVVRSKDGKAGSAGDAIVTASIAGLSSLAAIPRIDQGSGRLPGGVTIRQSIENMLKLTTSAWSFSEQDAQGALRINDGQGNQIAILPVGQVLADSERPDGVQCSGNGVCQTIAGNIITTFNAALNDPSAFISALRQIDPVATLTLNVDGNLQIAVGGRVYVAQAGWNVQPGSGASGFISDANGVSFNAATGKQVLYPVLADLNRLQTVLKKIDPSVAVQGDHQGHFLAVLNGQTYRLTPAWELIATPAAHATDDYWVDNGNVYLNYLDGHAQAFSAQ